MTPSKTSTWRVLKRVICQDWIDLCRLLRGIKVIKLEINQAALWFIRPKKGQHNRRWLFNSFINLLPKLEVIDHFLNKYCLEVSRFVLLSKVGECGTNIIINSASLSICLFTFYGIEVHQSLRTNGYFHHQNPL